MLIPSWCIGPDGTVLWPIESDCGCIAEKSLRGIVGDSRNTSYLPVVIQSCKKHFETVVRIAAEDNGPYAKRWQFYDGEFLPKMHTDEL